MKRTSITIPKAAERKVEDFRKAHGLSFSAAIARMIMEHRDESEFKQINQKLSALADKVERIEHREVKT